MAEFFNFPVNDSNREFVWLELEDAERKAEACKRILGLIPEEVLFSDEDPGQLELLDSELRPREY